MKNKLVVTLFVFLLSLSALSLYTASGSNEYPEELFSINIRDPGKTIYNELFHSISDELRKIGITTSYIVEGGWDPYYQIISEDRGADGYPKFDDGGYDIFFYNTHNDLEYDPTSSYSNIAFPPMSDNFAFFDNYELSSTITQYTSELDTDARRGFAWDIQSIVFEQQPYISIVNPVNIWAYDSAWSGITGDDFTLLLSTLNLRDGWKDINNPSTKDIVYGHPFEISELGPFSSRSYIQKQITNPLYPGLYERDPFEFAPIIANSLPSWNENNTIATIEINSNATFVTGNPVTVDDIVNSFHMHMTPAWSTGWYNSLVSQIASNDSVIKLDTSHLQITLNQPYFNALQLFSVPILDLDEIGTPSMTISYGGIPLNQVLNLKKYLTIGMGMWV
ncbi:MAG: ABC transporter substrate-binding protein [Candidatus Kariarchaeaceae archaeon]|jgi:ABC-type transport system substrate-binding protein